MKRIDWFSNEIEFWGQVLRVSTGTVNAVARARLLDLLAGLSSLTAGQGQEIVRE